MLKNSLSRLAVGVAIAVASMASASALTVISAGYKIIFDNYDSGTVYGSTPGTVCGGLGGGAGNIASCNLAATTSGLVAAGSIGSSNTSADTMGIISVAAITRIIDGSTLFTRGIAGNIGGVAVGPFLTGTFGGLTDYAVANGCVFGACTTTAFSTGGSFSLWSNATDYNPLLGPGVVAGTKDLNSALYPTISSGTLFLGGVFAAGATAVDVAATYVSQFGASTVAGSSSGFLDFTSGAAFSVFNTSAEVTNIGTFADAFLTTTFRPNEAANTSGWTVFSSGDVSGSIEIPEPGSLALVALALLGLGASAGRRKSR